MAPLGHATTCSPKVLAVPITVLAMDSSLRCLRWSSLALIFAISYTCFNDIVPIISCPGRAGPFSNPAVCFKSQVVGGVLVTKLNVRSGCTVILVGIGTPGSMWPVLALNSLQKSMDFTPRAPRAGPTGGLGVAFPAAINRRCTKQVSDSMLKDRARVYSPPGGLDLWLLPWTCVQDLRLGREGDNYHDGMVEYKQSKTTSDLRCL